MLTPFIAARLRRQQGATAVEYGLIAGLIAVAIIGALLVIGPQLGELFGKVQDAVTSANTQGNGTP